MVLVTDESIPPEMPIIKDSGSLRHRMTIIH